MELDIPGVDTELGLSYYGDDMSIYLPLLHSYVLNTPVSLAKVRTVTPETLKEYVVAIHGLKGTSASIGAETAREAAQDLEAMARAGDLDGILTNNETFIKIIEKNVAGIKEWLANYDDKNRRPLLKTPDIEVLERLKQGCKSFNMRNIDKAMSELEKTDYEQDAGLVAWLREKVNISEFSEVVERIDNYKEELNV
jgi:chemotaxis protein histidine kinase CheA